MIFVIYKVIFFRENMPSHFKVKEYCPMVFRNIRERFGIDDLDYKESLTRWVISFRRIVILIRVE